MGRFTLLRRCAIYFAVWTAFGLFFFSQDLSRAAYFHDPSPWWWSLVSWLVGVWISAALTPAIVWLGRRFPLERRGWPARLALHVLCAVGFAALELVLDSAVLPRLGDLGPFGGKSFGETLSLLAVLSFHGNLVAYAVVLGIQHAIRHYRRLQEREAQALRLELQASALSNQLVRAQLSSLKMQLQPHFLFNTLNAIMVLVRQQRGKQAEQTLARLSDLLRRVLDDVEAHEVPLRRELEFLRLYLSIEELRFQDRLRVEIVAAPALLDAAVPHMGLQPLVENAVRHGIGRSSAAGLVRISAARVGDVLELRVEDDGPGVSDDGGDGIGLSNTRARLAQLYGAAGVLTLANRAGGGAIATMTLPYRDLAVTSDEVMEVHAAQRAHRG